MQPVYVFYSSFSIESEALDIPQRTGNGNEHDLLVLEFLASIVVLRDTARCDFFGLGFVWDVSIVAGHWVSQGRQRIASRSPDVEAEGGLTRKPLPQGSYLRP